MAELTGKLLFFMWGAGAFAVLVGVLGVLGPLNNWDGGSAAEAILIGVGGVLLVLPAFFRRFLMSHTTSSLVVDSNGLVFTQKSGKEIRIDWDDPLLKVVLGEFTADAKAFFPKVDARRTHPQWVVVYGRTGRLPVVSTVLPSEALVGILQSGAARGVRPGVKFESMYWKRTASGVPLTLTTETGDQTRNLKLTTFLGRDREV